MSDTLELIDLEELVDENQIYCESPWHGAPQDEVRNAHGQGGPFWYVNFLKGCHCLTPGIYIRCNSWVRMIQSDPDKTLRSCSCGGTYRVIVLSQVINS